MAFKIPKVVEHFCSIQGEGQRAGKTCIFIRFFGCTLPGCPGFGQKDPTKPETWEKQELKPDIAPKYGCDSPRSWHKPFSHLCKSYESVEELFADTIMKYPANQRQEIIITGGEPMLYQEFLVPFMERCIENGTTNITIETNGMIGPNENMNNFLERTLCSILFSVSPKLNCVAGVDESKSIQLPVLRRYLEYVKNFTYIDVQFKFVVNEDERAFNRVLQLRDEILDGRNGDYDYFKSLLTPRILLMPVGAENHTQEMKQRVAQICVEHGFSYCPRLHVDIWGSKVGV